MRYVLSSKILSLSKPEFSKWINTKSRASEKSKKRYWREWRRYNKGKGVKTSKKTKEIKVQVSKHLQLEKDGLRDIKDVFAKQPIIFTKLTFDRDIKKLAKVFRQLIKYRPKKAEFLRLIVGYKVKTSGKAYKLPEHLGSKIRPVNKYKQAFTRLDMLLAHVTFSASVSKVAVYEESIRFYGDLQPLVETKNDVLGGRH